LGERQQLNLQKSWREGDLPARSGGRGGKESFNKEKGFRHGRARKFSNRPAPIGKRIVCALVVEGRGSAGGTGTGGLPCFVKKKKKIFRRPRGKENWTTGTFVDVRTDPKDSMRREKRQKSL